MIAVVRHVPWIRAFVVLTIVMSILLGAVGVVSGPSKSEQVGLSALLHQSICGTGLASDDEGGPPQIPCCDHASAWCCGGGALPAFEAAARLGAPAFHIRDVLVADRLDAAVTTAMPVRAWDAQRGPPRLT